MKCRQDGFFCLLKVSGLLPNTGILFCGLVWNCHQICNEIEGLPCPVVLTKLMEPMWSDEVNGTEKCQFLIIWPTWETFELIARVPVECKPTAKQVEVFHIWFHRSPGK